MSLIHCIPPFLFACTVGLFVTVIACICARRGRMPEDALHTQPLPPLAPLTDEDRAMLTLLRRRPAVALDVAYARGEEKDQEGEHEHDEREA
jgi:hypothetical protein